MSTRPTKPKLVPEAPLPNSTSHPNKPTHLPDGQLKHVGAVESDDRQGRHEESHQRQVELCACMCVRWECGSVWQVLPRPSCLQTKPLPSPTHIPTRPHHALHLLCGAVMRISWAASTFASFRTASHSWSSASAWRFCLGCLPLCFPIFAPGARCC